jgi:hypothetical protein
MSEDTNELSGSKTDQSADGGRMLRGALVGAAICAGAGFPLASCFGNFTPCGHPTAEWVLMGTVAADGCLAFFGAAVGACLSIFTVR